MYASDSGIKLEDVCHTHVLGSSVKNPASSSMEVQVVMSISVLHGPNPRQSQGSTKVAALTHLIPLQECLAVRMSHVYSRDEHDFQSRSANTWAAYRGCG